MSGQSKEDNNQPRKNPDHLADEGVDELLDTAIDNAKARKELSETELDEVSGGMPPIFTLLGLHRE